VNYLVIGLVDAVVNIDVEADSPEAALEEAQSSAHASVCGQCSEELEVGDFYGWRVLEDGGAGEEVYSDDEAKGLRARLATLEAAAREVLLDRRRCSVDCSYHDRTSVDSDAIDALAKALESEGV